MKVVVLSQYFPPEVGATQTRVVTFARQLAAAGHDVTVVAELPNHPVGRVFDGWRGRPVRVTREDGFRAIRVWVYASTRKSRWRRISFYGTYLVSAIVAALVLVRRRPDVILASSPPLPVLVAAAVLSFVWRRPFVADIRDIWPAVGEALGEIPPGRAMALATELERRLYRAAAAITCVTPGFVEHIAANGGRRDAIQLVPNGTIPEVFDPERADPGTRAALGLEGRFVVGYVGLHGIAQGLGALLDAAAELPDVYFLFIGEGPVKADLVARADAEGLANVQFHGQVPVEQVVSYIRACDLVVVPLRDLPVLSTFVPSKLFDMLCTATPVVLMVDGEARRILKASGGGLYAPAEDGFALATAVRQLRDDPKRRAAMGRAGREYVLANYTRDVQAAALERVLLDVAVGDR